MNIVFSVYDCPPILYLWSMPFSAQGWSIMLKIIQINCIVCAGFLRKTTNKLEGNYKWIHHILTETRRYISQRNDSESIDIIKKRPNYLPGEFSKEIIQCMLYQGTSSDPMITIDFSRALNGKEWDAIKVYTQFRQNTEATLLTTSNNSFVLIEQIKLLLY